MAVLPIIFWPDDRLSARCDPVAPGVETERMVVDLFDTMYAASGRGLSAPQAGLMVRLFVMDVPWKTGRHSPLIFVNPSITEVAGTLVPGEESCLSIPGVTTVVSRPEWAVITWTDPQGKEHSRRFDGVEARCVQHEMDHLDGIVTLHRLDATSRDRALAEYAVLS